MQQAYQIQVIPNAFGILPAATPLWDSGQTVSRESADVPYGGPPLTPGGRHAWRVRVWDQAGTVSRWSGPGRHEFSGPDLGTGW